MENTQINETKLDYSIKSPQERSAFVEDLIKRANPSQLTPKYLELLSNYILDAEIKKSPRKKEILTDNRLVTINKREISYEGLISNFENGEDGLYNLFNQNKNILLEPKVEITEEDIAEVPGLKELRVEIEKLEAQAKKATGKRKYYLIKAIIEMRKDQYVLKGFYKQPIRRGNPASRSPSRIVLDENITFDQNNEPVSDGLVSFFNPDHIAALLSNLENLRVGVAGKVNSDFFYLVRDFESLVERALKNYPLFARIVNYKVCGKQNIDIQTLLEEEFGIKHTIQYISSLWCNRIPKIIAEAAKEEYLIWYYTFVERGQWKKCNRCGQTKLAHNRFFSKNNTSKDGWYSLCKDCRNAKTKEKK